MSSGRMIVRKTKWGIFDVTYDVPNSFYSWRFFKDIFVIAPAIFSAYVLGTLWLGLNPALSLYFTYVVIHSIVDSISAQNISKYTFDSTIYFWLLSGIVSAVIEHLRDEGEALLCGYLRYHFLPLLAKANLEADIKVLHDDYNRRFTKSPSFEEGAPGLDLLKGIAYRCQHFLSLFLELSVVTLVIIRERHQDGLLLALLTVILLWVLFFAPSNGAEDQGYTFWTTNKAYNRLNALHTIVFSSKFRETLAKDSLNDYLLREYAATSRVLGVVKSDALTLACHLPPPWYWTLIHYLLLDYPMVLCALVPARFISPYSVSTLLFFKSISSMFGHSVDNLTFGRGSTAFGELFVKIRELYEQLDASPSLQRESIVYPNSERSSSKGMKINLRDVGFSYTDGGRCAQVLEGLSLKVDAGSLVMLVGSSGSGKSTLLKLLAGLQEPSSGEILIDDVPITRYNTLQLRQHITFLMQPEELYPLSIRENMLMVVPRPLSDEEVDTKLEHALRLGGAYEIVGRLGYETVLNPPSLLGQSLQGCGNGKVGPGALRELEKRVTSRKHSVISCKEKRRLLISRSFMRLLNSDTRLLMVDEPAGALDAVAEHDIFQNFLRQRKGKTVILVPHRFGHIAKHADLVLCMKEGKVVEYGRHGELLQKNGEYANLFRAQVEETKA